MQYNMYMRVQMINYPYLPYDVYCLRRVRTDVDKDGVKEQEEEEYVRK
jgi:hypothetical protein